MIYIQNPAWYKLLRIENIRLFFLNAHPQKHAEILCEEESSAEE